MTNKMLLLAACLAFSGVATAQSFFGPKIGATLATVDVDADGATIDPKSNLNAQIGLALDLGLLRGFSIQPELSYQGRSYTYSAQFLGVNTEVRQNIAFLELGALAKVRFNPDEGLGFYLGAGPFVNYAISGKTKYTVGGNEESVDIDFGDDEIRRTDVSLAGALGLTINLGGPLFFAEGRYVVGFSDFDETNESEIRYRTIVGSLGFMIPL